jgi:hypothetical protein
MNATCETGPYLKPNISVLIRDMVSIKDNKIHESDPHEAEHHFN